jgi:hypothetical protein
MEVPSTSRAARTLRYFVWRIIFSGNGKQTTQIGIVAYEAADSLSNTGKMALITGHK